MKIVNKLINKTIENIFQKENIEKIFPVMALFFLVITIFSVLFKNDKAAEQSAIWVYYFLILTVIYHFFEFLYKRYEKYFKFDYKNKIKNCTSNTLQKYIKTIYLAIKNYKYSFIIFITTLIVMPWFLASGYLFFIDFSWGPAIVLDYSSPIAPVFDLLHFIGNIASQDFVQKIFISSIMFYTLYSGYKIGGNSIALLSLFNPFVYDRLMYGQIGVVLSYVFTLNIINIFLKIYDNKNICERKDIYKISIFYGLSILSSPHFIFINGLLILAFAFYFKDEIKEKMVMDKLNNFWKVLLKSFLIILSINIIWISKIFTSSSSTINYIKSGINDNDLTAFATLGDNFFVKTWNIVNFSGFWGANFQSYINLQDRTFYFLYPLIIWILVFLCMYNVYYKNKKLFNILIFLIVSSIILAQASTLPIIKNVLYNMPFYNGMREPQKWVALLTAVTIFIVSVFIKHTKKIEYKYIIGFISFMWVPYLLFGFYGQVQATKYPDYWIEIDKKLIESNCHDGTTAIMPWHMYIKYDWVGKVSANPAINFFACDVITGTNMEWGNIYDNSTDPVGSLVSNFVLSKGVLEMPENIKAVILFKDQDYTKYDFLNNYEKLNETNKYIIYKIN